MSYSRPMSVSIPDAIIEGCISRVGAATPPPITSCTGWPERSRCAASSLIAARSRSEAWSTLSITISAALFLLSASWPIWSARSFSVRPGSSEPFASHCRLVTICGSRPPGDGVRSSSPFWVPCLRVSSFCTVFFSPRTAKDPYRFRRWPSWSPTVRANRFSSGSRDEASTRITAQSRWFAN